MVFCCGGGEEGETERIKEGRKEGEKGSKIALP